jgi:TRAP-type C4-dicarboxylate transport system permease small subunit
VKLIRFLDRNGEKILALWLYLFIVVVIFNEVIRRFVLSYSSLWGEETARYSFIYMVWIGAAMAVKDRLHIRITIIVDHFGNRLQNFFSMLASVLGMILAVIAMRYSMEPFLLSIKYQSVTDGLRIVQAWYLFAVPFGFTLIMIRFIQVLIEDWGSFVRNVPPKSREKLFQ